MSLRHEVRLAVKKADLVGHGPGPETLVVLVGTFRCAATWAASQGLHVNQWVLIESWNPLAVYDRRFPPVAFDVLPKHRP